MVPTKGSTYDEMLYEVPVGNLVKVNVQQEKMLVPVALKHSRSTQVYECAQTHTYAELGILNSGIRVYTTFFPGGFPLFK